jgi:hypothetical protein
LANFLIFDILVFLPVNCWRILSHLVFLLRIYLLIGHSKIKLLFIGLFFIKLGWELIYLISKFKINFLVKLIIIIFIYFPCILICLYFLVKNIKFLFLSSWWVYSVLMFKVFICIYFFKISKKLNLFSALF